MVIFRANPSYEGLISDIGTQWVLNFEAIALDSSLKAFLIQAHFKMVYI